MEIGSGAARNRCGISWRSSASVCSRRPSRRGSMRRKPLPPPPQRIQPDPATQQPVTKRKRNKGRQRASRLTINGRIDLCRRWWYAPGAGSECPTDALLLPREVTVTRGVREATTPETEKAARRQKVLEQRRRRGRKCPPLPPRKKGTDNAWKEFKTITFYSQDQRCRHVILSKRRRTEVGGLVRREAERLGLARADDKVANVDGATWIRHLLEGLQHVMRLDAIGLDFYHLSENVRKDRRLVLCG